MTSPFHLASLWHCPIRHLSLVGWNVNIWSYEAHYSQRNGLDGRFCRRRRWTFHLEKKVHAKEQRSIFHNQRLFCRVRLHAVLYPSIPCFPEQGERRAGRSTGG